MSSFLKTTSEQVTKVAKSLGGYSSKRKATSTPLVSDHEPNYQEGYDQELHDFAEEVEREIQIEEEEEEPTTPIGILRSRQSSTRSHEIQQQQQQQQRQAHGERVNFQSISYFYNFIF